MKNSQRFPHEEPSRHDNHYENIFSVAVTKAMETEQV